MPGTWIQVGSATGFVDASYFFAFDTLPRKNENSFKEVLKDAIQKKGIKTGSEVSELATRPLDPNSIPGAHMVKGRRGPTPSYINQHMECVYRVFHLKRNQDFELCFTKSFYPKYMEMWSETYRCHLYQATFLKFSDFLQSFIAFA